MFSFPLHPHSSAIPANWMRRLWWIAEFVIDEKEYGTQGKTLTELELMVKDAAEIMTDTPREEFLIVFENYS